MIDHRVLLASCMGRLPGLLVSPRPLLPLLHHPAQLAPLLPLLSELARSELNAAVIASLQHEGCSLTQILIAETFRSRSAPKEGRQLLELLVTRCGLTRTELRALKQLLQSLYYSQSLSVQHIDLAASLFELALKPCPSTSTIILNGVPLQFNLSEKKWPFAKGFTVRLKVFLEAVSDRPAVLFSFNNGSGCYQAYMQGLKVYFRTNTAEKEGFSQYLGQLQLKKWHFIGLVLQEGKMFSKWKITFFLDRNIGLGFNCQPAKSNGQVCLCSFFGQMYGFSQSITVLNKPIGPKVQDFYYGVKPAPGYVLLVEPRVGGWLAERSGLFKLKTDSTVVWQKNISLDQPLALLHYLTIAKKTFFATNPLIRILGVIRLVLFEDPTAQKKAVAENLFGVVGHHFSLLPSQMITVEAIAQLKDIRRVITEQKLLQSLFLELLWNSQAHRNYSSEVGRAVVEEAAWYYSYNSHSFGELFGPDRIIDTCLYKLDCKELDCCQKHRSQSQPGVKRPQSILAAFQIIYELMEKSGSLANEVNLAAKSLCLDCSPCLKLQLMRFIGKAIFQPKTQEALPRYLLEHKCYLSVIHLLRSTVLPDLFSQALLLLFDMVAMKLISVSTKEINNIVEQQLEKFVPKPEPSPVPKRAKSKKVEPVKQEEEPVKQQKPKRKKTLTIDTDQINKQFSAGGQHGRKLTVDETDLNWQIAEIRKLAKYCARVMRGQIMKGEELPQKGDDFELELIKRHSNKSQTPFGKHKKPLLAVDVEQCLSAVPSSSSSSHAPQAGPPKPLPSMRGPKPSFTFNFPSDPAAPPAAPRAPKPKKAPEQESVSKDVEQIVQSVMSIVKARRSSQSHQAAQILVALVQKFPGAGVGVLGGLLLNMSGQVTQRVSRRLVEGLFQIIFTEVRRCVLGGSLRLQLVKMSQNLVKMIYSGNCDRNAEERFLLVTGWRPRQPQVPADDPLLLWTRRAIWNSIISLIGCAIFQSSKPQQYANHIIYTTYLLLHEYCDQLPLLSARRYFFLDNLPLELQALLPSNSRWADRAFVESTLSISAPFLPKLLTLILNDSPQKEIYGFLGDSKLAEQVAREAESFIVTNGLARQLLTMLAMYIEDACRREVKVSNYEAKLLRSIFLYTIISHDVTKHKLSRVPLEEAEFALHFMARILKQFPGEPSRTVESELLLAVSQCKTVSDMIESKYCRLPFYEDYRRRQLLVLYEIIYNHIKNCEKFPTYQQLLGTFDSKLLPKLASAKVVVASRPEPEESILPLYQDYMSTLEEEMSLKFRTIQALSEESRRLYCNRWKKLWSRTNRFRPGLEDHLLVRICKFQSRIRTRVFLKKKLLLPEYVTLLLRPEHRESNLNLSPLQRFIARGQDSPAEKDPGVLSALGANAVRVFLPSAAKGKASDQNISFKEVQWVTSLTLRHGILAILGDKLLFMYSRVEETPNHIALKAHSLKPDRRFIKEWPLELLKEVFRRRFVGRRNALQLSFLDGTSLLFNFPQGDSEDMAHKLIRLRKSRCLNLDYEHKTLDPRKLIEKDGLTKRWMNREVSNLHYLMHLNWLAGRSYRDLAQYPVLPWVLSEYSAQHLDLASPLVYRDLAKPMGALGPQERTNLFREKFRNPDIYSDCSPFHYGTHYSTAGITYHFLIRLQPFTEASRIFQGGKFDIADRLFYCIADAYKFATSEPADVRQLIPEFYTLPEMFLNEAGLDLGTMQNGYRVNHVELPPYCDGSPYKFVGLSRAALQSEAVSQALHGWIDIIFGYKQRGKQAEKSLNCFHELTYEDAVDFDKAQDNLIAVESQIMSFGQTPSQLFSKPHPKRNPRRARLLCDSESQLRVFRPAQRADSPSRVATPFNIMDSAADSLVLLKWIDMSCFLSIKRGGLLRVFSWAPDLTAKTAPFQCGMLKQKVVQKIRKTEFNLDQSFDPLLSVSKFPAEVVNSGQHLLLGGHVGGLLLLLSMESEQVVEQYYSPLRHTISVVRADSRKENLVITGDVGGHVVLWRVCPEPRLVESRVSRDFDSEVSCVDINKQLRCFAVGSAQGLAVIYNLVSGKELTRIDHGKPISEIVVSSTPVPCVVLLATKIQVYSINGSLLQTFEDASRAILGLTLLRDSFFNDHLAFSNSRGELLIRELPWLQSGKRVMLAKDSAGICLLPSPDQHFLLAGCSDGEITILVDPKPF